jgi:Domain of unknown function (DUF4956)
MHEELWSFLRDSIVSVPLGLLIGFAYARAYRGLFFSVSFVHACVVTVPLITFAVGVIATAGAGQALAFALVGLLGLIRFRTVVRDTREFTFVFLAIVTGLGVGSGHPTAAAGGCIFVLILLLLLEKTRFGVPRALSFRAKATGKEGALITYQEILNTVAERVEPLSIRRAPGGGPIYTFDLAARAGEDLASVAGALWAVPETTEVSVSRLERGQVADGDT